MFPFNPHDLFSLKKTLTLVALVLWFTSARGQQTEIRLIVRGDDMGFSHSGNLALMQSAKEGIESSIEVIVPSPWFPEAVQLLEEIPTMDVGIHLALTSEWDHVKWRPLTDCPSLRDADGYFYPMVFPNKNYPGRSIAENKWNIADVEKEFRAQIEMALNKIPRISHISAHMGCTSLNKEVRELTKKLAAEYKIPVDPEPQNLVGVRYDGPHKTSSEKVESFLSMLKKLESGKTYLFVDHPGLDDAELRAIHHVGYEDVAEDRQGVTDTFTNPKVKALIKERNIRLIGYRDLGKNK
jgi:chitin disaccharide deacetylase